VYGYIYTLYQKQIGQELSAERITAYSRFTKRGWYNYVLDEVRYPILLDPSNGGVDAEIFADGNYEPGILKLLQSYVSSEAIFLDVGVNIGNHSLYLARFCKQIYAFEPIKSLYDQFLASIFANDILNIHAYNYALGKESKTLPIYGNHANMGTSSITVHDGRHKIQDIKILKLDDVYQDIGITRIDVMKIDVEGYELDVLLGAVECIKKYKPVLLIEYSPRLYNATDKTIAPHLIELLYSLGYSITDIRDGGTHKKIINTIEEFGDIQQTNILCIPKK
jgi:FkbM family methyltransferase